MSARHSRCQKNRAADTPDQRFDDDHWYSYQSHDIVGRISFVMSNLKLCTWNGTVIMPSAFYLSNMLTEETADICGLSEH